MEKENTIVFIVWKEPGIAEVGKTAERKYFAVVVEKRDSLAPKILITGFVFLGSVFVTEKMKGNYYLKNCHNMNIIVRTLNIIRKLSWILY